jgi:hypothetical protein
LQENFARFFGKKTAIKSFYITMKLYYFDCYALGEPIRMLLHLAEIEYENVVFSYEQRFEPGEYFEWKKTAELPFSQVPMLEIEEGDGVNGKTEGKTEGKPEGDDSSRNDSDGKPITSNDSDGKPTTSNDSDHPKRNPPKQKLNVIPVTKPPTKPLTKPLKLAQTNAILGYLGSLWGFVPTDALSKYRGEAARDHFYQDFWVKHCKQVIW